MRRVRERMKERTKIQILQSKVIQVRIFIEDRMIDHLEEELILMLKKM